MLRFITPILLILMLACPAGAVQIRQIGLSDGLFSDQVQSVCQDAEGLVWVGTRYGLTCTDGEKVTTYFPSRGIDPTFSNSILCVSNDGSERIYIVTKSGFAYYDKRLDTFVLPEQSEVTKRMWIVKCLPGGQVLIGHDAGVARYDLAENRVREYSSLGTDINVTGSVKCIIEDRMGQVWIGTWGNNFYRYSPQEQKLYHYPSLNQSKSAVVICQDANGCIWVGSWDNGLYRLIDPYNLEQLKWQEYDTSNSSLHDYRIYSMACDPVTGHLWVGHRKGVSVLNDNGEFVMLGDEIDGLPQLGEVDCIAPGSGADIWLGTLGQGIVSIDTHPAIFQSSSTGYPGISEISAVVTSTYIDRDSTVWAGFGPYGVAKIGESDRRWTFPYKQIGFGDSVNIASVYALCELRSGDLALATYNGDVIKLDKNRQLSKVYRHEESIIHADGHIYDLFEDSSGNLWAASSQGAGVLMADGRQKVVGNLDSRVSAICQVGDEIYLSTTERGLFRCALPSHDADSISVEPVDLQGMGNQALITDIVVAGNCMLLSTETNGIYAYYPSTGQLVRTNFITPSIGTRISSLLLDPEGTLWIATNRGLCAKAEGRPLLKFTTSDGLLSDVMMGGMHYRDGRVAVGTSNGVMQFDASKVIAKAMDYFDTNQPFGIVGLTMEGHSFESMSIDERREATGGVTPYYADKITIMPAYNSITLDYGHPAEHGHRATEFACMLQGYDADWRVGESSATYSNLPYGSYTFRVKPLGSDQEKTVLIEVARPWYHSYWAYCLYVIGIALIMYASLSFMKRREREKSRIKVLEMEKESMQQVNHTKLVFFTNITHELLTPLTVISAGIDELKDSASSPSRVISLMDVNVKRLVRLLQQILEFRKAESNNLRLKVSYGDVAQFVLREADALRPLINKKHQTLTVTCKDEPLMGYYDVDKLDKILYNLLSNAAKYTGERGSVDLSVERDGDYMVIKVADQGRGIPKDKMKDLFTRFYDGEYREFKTIGTGIGLSLTRDLVELSHGTIEVESEEGKGTTFTVRLPIEASHFSPDEMQSVESVPAQSAEAVADAPQAEPVEDEKRETVMIVEDNEDLRAMMVRLLEHDYNTLDAPNGRAALELMAGREVDIVITDVMMPVMDGLALTRKLKQDINTSHIPIIVLTAKNQTEDRAEAYECGADAYISKPFNLTVLHARIRNLLKSRSRRAQDFKNQLVVEIKDMDYDSLDENFIRRAIEIVEKHLDDAEFEVPQFAKEIGVGKTTLFNKLKSLTGMNPTSFIRNVRLKASCKIMNERPGIRVSDLAYMVGFSDPKYFSICFKREFGMSPTTYAEQAPPHGID